VCWQGATAHRANGEADVVWYGCSSAPRFQRWFGGASSGNGYLELGLDLRCQSRMLLPPRLFYL
jgi:hypothetical protein